MKNEAFFQTGYHKLERQEIPMPEPKDNEVVVKIEYLGICGSDLHMFNDDFDTFKAEDAPEKVMLGHETAGTIVAAGKNVKKIKVGDRVTVEPSVPCGTCEYCKRGLYNLCDEMRMLGCPPDWKGGMQKYMSYPANFVYKLPDNMSTMEGALVEPLCVGLHSAAQAGISLGDTAVIVGCGCIGLTVLLACKARGASKVVMVDVFDSRLAKAKEMGADAVVNSANCDVAEAVKEILGDLPQFVFETAGTAAVVDACIKLAKKGGTITFTGNISRPAPVTWVDLAEKELTVKTVFRYRNLYPTAINAISSGSINIAQIVNKEFTFDEMQHVLEECDANRRDILKAVVCYSCGEE